MGGRSNGTCYSIGEHRTDSVVSRMAITNEPSHNRVKVHASSATCLHRTLYGSYQPGTHRSRPERLEAGDFSNGADGSGSLSGLGSKNGGGSSLIFRSS